jgi:hypothetical protein
VAATKKTTISDRQCTYNSIVRALTIGNFTIDRPALLEINCKIPTMGGAIVIVSKNRTLFVWHLYVFCLQKKSGAPELKNGGTNGPDPLPLCGKNLVNTQYRHVWEKFGMLGNRMFPTVNVQNTKQCSGASERKNLEPPTNNGWILRKHCEVLFCHIKRLCLK